MILPGRNILPGKRLAGGRGFTLVELIVVMAIIAILISLIASVATSVRVRAQEQRTQADLKTLLAAVQEFQESTGAAPPDYPPPGATPPNLWRVERLALLLRDLDRHEKIKSTLRDYFPADRFSTRTLVLGAGPAESCYVILDVFKTPFDYVRDGGPGGAPVFISAGADGAFGTADDLRSDERPAP